MKIVEALDRLAESTLAWFDQRDRLDEVCTRAAEAGLHPRDVVGLRRTALHLARVYPERDAAAHAESLLRSMSATSRSTVE